MAETVRAAAVDWSGKRTGERASICVASASGGRLESIETGVSRPEAIELVIELASAGPRFVAGFDFSFSLPAWFLKEQGLAAAPDLWDLSEEAGEEWLTSCKPPFWGRPGCRRPVADPERPQFRAIDVETAAAAGQSPRSPFQVSGAGSVGAATVRGLPHLRTLRSAGFSLWPWDHAESPVAVEIWTRLAIGPTVKSNSAARRAAVRSADGIGQQLEQAAAETEDSFDAAMSAVWLSATAGSLFGRPASIDPTDRLEGRTWRP